MKAIFIITFLLSTTFAFAEEKSKETPKPKEKTAKELTRKEKKAIKRAAKKVRSAKRRAENIERRKNGTFFIDPEYEKNRFTIGLFYNHRPKVFMNGNEIKYPGDALEISGSLLLIGRKRFNLQVGLSYEKNDGKSGYNFHKVFVSPSFNSKYFLLGGKIGIAFATRYRGEDDGLIMIAPAIDYKITKRILIGIEYNILFPTGSFPPDIRRSIESVNSFLYGLKYRF